MVANNKLKNIDLSKNTAFTNMVCPGKLLSEMIFPDGVELVNVNCCRYKLLSLNLSENPNLKELRCSTNFMPNLNVKSNPLMEVLLRDTNNLGSIDLTHNLELSSLTWSGNNFSNLYGYGNKLTTLGLSKNLKLIDLRCYRNQMVGFLDISKQTGLQAVDFFFNNIESVHVNNNKELSVFGA